MIFFALFGNGHYYNVVSTLINVVKLNVEKDNVVLMLSNVVHTNVEIHNVDSTFLNVVNSNVKIRNIHLMLIWGCLTPRRHVNQKATLKQH